MKILVVEDDQDISTLISFHLKSAGHSVFVASDGKKALEGLKKENFDLALLDILLPEVSGIEILKFIRKEKDEKMMVIMLSALEDDSVVISALENGADDYITKPFSPRVLLAKINTIRRLKRDEKEKDIVSSPTGIKMDKKKRKCVLDGKDLKLKETEFDILFILLSYPEKVFSRKELIEKLRGDDYFVVERSVDVQMTGLRKKLGSLERNINTVWGIGYRWTENP